MKLRLPECGQCRWQAIALAALLAGCREPTQVIVELTTDINCADNPRTGIASGDLGDIETRPFTAETEQCTLSTGRIGSIVVVPEGDKNGEFAVRVVAGIDQTAEECVANNYTGLCVVARRALNFVPHSTLYLPIRLEASCIGVPCEATQTCRSGTCVSAKIDNPRNCTPNGGCDVGAGGGYAGTGGMAATGGVAATGGRANAGGAPTGGTSAAGGSVATGGVANVTYTMGHNEVPQAIYLAWLLSGPSTAGQPPECAWNTDFTPTCDWSAPIPSYPFHPVVCVDWCDAYAFCKALGQRLCGKIGGGANDFSLFADASQSQWQSHCTSGGKYTYPYGNAYSSTDCNGSDAGNGRTLDIGNLKTCQSSDSAYAGYFDMSGNVMEWEDSCRSSDDYCRIRGGSFNSTTKASLSCAADNSAPRNTTASDIGFRCCPSP